MKLNINIKEYLDWFLSKSKNHQAEILLIVICGLLGFGVYKQQERLNENQQALNQQRHAQIISDSICNARYHTSLITYQKSLRSCEEKQREFLESQAKKWQLKYERLFITSDSIYHQLNH